MDNNISTARGATKPLIVGKAWDNGVQVSATGINQRRLKIRIDQQLGINLLVVPSTEFDLWEQTLPKREGRQDPDYSVSVQLPTEIVDAEIARQRAMRSATASVEEVQPVLA